MSDEKTVIQRVLARSVPANGKKVYRGIRQEIPIPGEKKPGRPKKLTRKEWSAEYSRALRSDVGFKTAMKKLAPRHAALLVAWATNGNNLSRAAKQLNYSPETAKSIAKSPAFREAMRYVDTFVPSEERQWMEILPAARYTLVDLLRSSDDKVRYLAAKDIADRAEGKAIARMDLTVRDENVGMSDGEMQLAFSIMQQRGLGFAETIAWIRGNPEAVQQWIDANVTPSAKKLRGSPAIDADYEVLPEDHPEVVSQAQAILEASKAEISAVPRPLIAKRDSPT